jgi:hypothetical protein
LPRNASGGALLNVIALAANVLVANSTFRVMIASPPPPLPSPRMSEEFSFCSTVEWHVQAALLGSGLLDQQMFAHRGLGINCLHVYLGEDRMLQMMRQPFALEVAKVAAKANITYLYTLLPNRILDGTCGQPGSNCAQAGEFPISAFCKNTVATRVPPSVPSPRPGKTTTAQLERMCELAHRLAKKMSPFVKYWALEGEPQSNGLAAGEYAARVLPVLSTAVRDGAGPGAVLIGGGIVNGFRDEMWNNTIKDGHEFFDAFAFHPYRFDRLDPESSCLGGCGSTFRSQLLTANQDLAHAGAVRIRLFTTYLSVHSCPLTYGMSQAPRVYLTEEATGVTLQRTRAVGWPAVGGYDLSMRLGTFSQEELLMANYIVRMWVTAMGERAIGYVRIYFEDSLSCSSDLAHHRYNLHAGDENLLFLDDIGTPTLGAVAIHTMAVTLRLGHAGPAGRLLNFTAGPGPGPGNTVPLPTGPFRGYMFEQAGLTGGDIVAAVWTADAEFATVGTLRLGGLSAAQLKAVFVIDTYGNAIGTRLIDDRLEMLMGRDVLYVVFPSTSTVTNDQARTAVTQMLALAAGQVGGSLGWPTPFW